MCLSIAEIAPGVSIHHDGEVPPRAGHFQVGDVRDPNLVSSVADDDSGAWEKLDGVVRPQDAHIEISGPLESRTGNAAAEHLPGDTVEILDDSWVMPDTNVGKGRKAQCSHRGTVHAARTRFIIPEVGFVGW